MEYISYFDLHTQTPDTMIPLGSDDSPRLVIGHNVGYDRVRLAEDYRLEKTGTRYLDTMALHIALAGMTSQQRLVWNSCKNLSKEELKHKPRSRFINIPGEISK